MEIISDRSRRVSVDELNTTQLLAHARKQAVQRKLDDMIIVDVDSHHYENECYDEFLPLIENDVLRQPIMAGRTKGRGQVHTGMTSFPYMGGRVTRYPLRFPEQPGKHAIRDVALAFRRPRRPHRRRAAPFPTALPPRKKHNPPSVKSQRTPSRILLGPVPERSHILSIPRAAARMHYTNPRY